MFSKESPLFEDSFKMVDLNALSKVNAASMIASLTDKNIPVEEKRQIIKENEISMPPELSNKIKIFINRKRVLGIKEERIKRMVKKIFNITVV